MNFYSFILLFISNHENYLLIETLRLISLLVNECKNTSVYLSIISDSFPEWSTALIYQNKPGFRISCNKIITLRRQLSLDFNVWITHRWKVLHFVVIFNGDNGSESLFLIKVLENIIGKDLARRINLVREVKYLSRTAEYSNDDSKNNMQLYRKKFSFKDNLSS